jgi:hypothetical protein
MHALALKFGALMAAPLMFFGGHAANAYHNNPHALAHGPTATSSAISITSIDGPSSVAVNTSGTWTVNVNTSATSSLHYSATWGDENSTASMRALTARTDTSATLTHTYASAGTYHPKFTVTDDNGHTATKSATVTVGATASLHLDSVAPTSGAVGATITVSGTGFADGNTVTVGGVKAATTTYNDDGTLTFTVPQLATGTYNVRVHDGDTKSNAVSFTVTAATPSLSINGVDAPIRLAVGADGTWTVHAATTGDSLKYSVKWGDEGTGSLLRAMVATPVQTSSTFTHAYQTAGTYTPKFTVTDDTGHSESVSATVVVTNNS